MKPISLMIVFIISGLVPLHVNAQLSKSDIEVQMNKISDHCREYASVLADAKWSKYKKSPNYREGMLTNKDYETEINFVQARCVSAENVLLLRMLKSTISAKDAIKMKLDESITKQMLIIEKTL